MTDTSKERGNQVFLLFYQSLSIYIFLDQGGKKYTLFLISISHPESQESDR